MKNYIVLIVLAPSTHASRSVHTVRLWLFWFLPV